MMLLANVALAIVWVSLIGSPSPGNLLAGFLVGFVLLWVAGGGRRGGPNYISVVVSGVELFAFAVFELEMANIRVAVLTVSRLKHLQPAILAVPIRDDLTDGEITLLANLITLTPGTLTLDVATDRRSLYVHFMHVEDPTAEIESIKSGFERRIVAMTRGGAGGRPSHMDRTTAHADSETPAHDTQGTGRAEGRGAAA